MSVVDSSAATTAPATQSPLRSVYTTTFAEILEHLGCSLLVSTYQAGKLVMLRADKGVVTTHFRNFPKPMGLALQGNWLAVGTEREVREYQNIPAVGAKLPPEGKRDALFLPRCSHVTGDIQIHEMAWVSPASAEMREAPDYEVWLVNTRFSCLCSLNINYSFIPRWRPPFITALAPDDRCHLNGVGLADGHVRYVTALGETNTADGWRANKRNGGIIMEVPSGAVLVRGLSMPHSPRWYQGKLWLLESGTGTIGTVDVSAGRHEPIAEVPGFSRGLDFCGNLAFIGLSLVRESAFFSRLPLTERLTERTCGVWIVDLTTCRPAGFLKFEDGVQEIFAVQVLPNVRFPDLINDDPKLLSFSFVLPDAALRDVPVSLRKDGQ